jgi:HEPN domain-containing protein
MTYRRPILLLAMLVLGACEQPTAPIVKGLELLSDAAVANFAEQVSESSDVRLPSLHGLLRAARKAIRASDGGNKQAIRHFRRARHFTSAAEDSTEAGNEEAAKKLRRRSYGHNLHGVVAALGTEAVERAIAGSEAGLTRLQGHLDGREVSEGVARRLAKVVEAVGKSQEKLAAGQPVVALHHALDAAQRIRHFSPRYIARKQIGRAREVIKQAVAAVGDAPTEEEAKSIRRARRLLGTAQEEFKAHRYNRARSAAQRSARLSWGVVNGRAG